MALSKEGYRLLLVGLTGSGKSSTGNTLVGTDCFKEGFGSKSETFKCKQGTMEWNGHEVQVMDSPGLFDTKKSHEEIADQVVLALFELRPGPHAFLYVVSISQRYTEEQYNAYKRLKEYFGNQITNFTIVVFTHGDSIKDKGMTLKQYIGNDLLSDDLTRVVKECGRRCILFDNTSKDKKPQVEDLMTMVDTLVKGKGNQHYKDTFPHDNVSGALKERVKKAEEEELKKKQHVIDLKRKRQEAERKRKQEEEARLRAEEAEAEAERKRKQEEEARIKAEKEKAEAERKREQEVEARIKAEMEKAEAERKRELEEKARQNAEEEHANLKETVRKEKEAQDEKKRRDRCDQIRKAERMEDEAETLRNQAKAQFVFAFPTLGLSTIKAKGRLNRAKELEREATQIREEYK